MPLVVTTSLVVKPMNVGMLWHGSSHSASDESATLMLLGVLRQQPNGQKEPPTDLRMQPETSAAGFTFASRARGPSFHTGPPQGGPQ